MTQHSYRKESGMIYVESVQYHSVGPDTPKSRISHTYVGDSESDPLENSAVYATAGWVGMDTDHAYENTEKNVNMYISVLFLYSSYVIIYYIYLSQEATPGPSLCTNSCKSLSLY